MTHPNMKVTLLDYPGRGRQDQEWYAADLMIFTKNTRIKMTPNGREEIAAWPVEKKLEELEYMANTIPASWEFCTYTFMIENVTRAFTHQLVRTRTASYAQQTQQILDMEGWEYDTGSTILENDRWRREYAAAMNLSQTTYRRLIDEGAKIEDVRGLLPTNVLTNIVMKTELRTLVGFIASRISARNLQEIRDVATEMRNRILEAHPWAELFLRRNKDRACDELEDLVSKCIDGHDPKTMARKLIDQIRRS